MGTHDYVLASPPTEPRDLELWLQHAAGFILLQDVRGFAVSRLDPSLDAGALAAARKAIDETLYGLMMVLDGVAGGLSNATHSVSLQTFVRLCERGPGGEREVARLDLFNGDGFCMGYHGWLQGDFGRTAVAMDRI
jgi:hypothetical protein